MLVAVNTTEKLQFASAIEVFGDLNTQIASKWEPSKKKNLKISSKLRDIVSK